MSTFYAAAVLIGIAKVFLHLLDARGLWNEENELVLASQGQNLQHGCSRIFLEMVAIGDFKYSVARRHL